MTMCHFISRSLATAVLAATTLLAAAQLPTVDITMVQNMDGLLEVKLRPDGPFAGVIVGLVFTIRWDADIDVSLGPVQQPLPAIQYIPIQKSDVEQDQDGYRYQIFAGFGFINMETIDVFWEAGEEYTVMFIEPSDVGVFELVNDDFTDANNGDFFISLNGVQTTTGVIYGLGTGIEAGGHGQWAATVAPNPTEGITSLFLETDATGELLLELHDLSGRLLQTVRNARSGHGSRHDIDLRDRAAGTYLLRATLNDRSRTFRITRR